MKVHIFQSTVSTTKKEFIKTMKNHKFNWKFMFFLLFQFNKSDWRFQIKFSYNFFYSISYEYTSALNQNSVSNQNWSFIRYNSYWKNKDCQSDFRFIEKKIQFSSQSQSQLSSSKQLLMITARTAIFNQYQYNWENINY